MRRTTVVSSARAAPRRHSLPVVFLAARRRVSHSCSRMRSMPTRPSLRRSHFGCDLDVANEQGNHKVSLGQCDTIKLSNTPCQCDGAGLLVADEVCPGNIVAYWPNAWLWE